MNSTRGLPLSPSPCGRASSIYIGAIEVDVRRKTDPEVSALRPVALQGQSRNSTGPPLNGIHAILWSAELTANAIVLSRDAETATG
jgi:hypothetical protein